jgi:trehalose-6-phosphate synthase
VAAELVAGLLANVDRLQPERDRRNFLMALKKSCTPRWNLSRRVRFRGRSTTVVSVPIGVDYDRIQQFAADPTLAGTARLRPARPAGRHHRLASIVWITPRHSRGLDALDALMAQRPDLQDG